MKKILILLTIMLFSIESGYCSLDKEAVNIYNLKKNSSYILNLETKAEKINVSDNKLLNIVPVTSIYNDGKQIFIDAIENGVCDVDLKTSESSYKIRFITGPNFEDNNGDIVLVDMPFD